jgi:hypothetical protein
MEEGSVIPARNREDLDSSREITKAVDQGILIRDLQAPAYRSTKPSQSVENSLEYI